MELEVVGDSLVEFGGDTHLLFAGWMEAHSAEGEDDAVGGKDGFTDYVVVVGLAGMLLDDVPLDAVLPASSPTTRSLRRTSTRRAYTERVS